MAKAIREAGAATAKAGREGRAGKEGKPNKEGKASKEGKAGREGKGSRDLARRIAHPKTTRKRENM